MFKILSTCKGGGYMYARTEPVHPKANSNGLYPLHRVLIEIHLNRILEKNEVVHHKDENKSNNAIENLEVITNSEHAKHHSKKVKAISVNCGCCGKEISIKPHEYRLRIGRNKSGKIFCTHSCGSSV